MLLQILGFLKLLFQTGVGGSGRGLRRLVEHVNLKEVQVDIFFLVIGPSLKIREYLCFHRGHCSNGTGCIAKLSTTYKPVLE